MRGDTEELPGYSPAPRRPRTGTGGFRREHRFSLKDRSGREWLSFKVNSRAVNTKNIPVFLDGDTVEGEVQLDLAKAQRLKCLTITVDWPASAVDTPSSPLTLAIFFYKLDSRGDDGGGPGGGTLPGQN